MGHLQVVPMLIWKKWSPGRGPGEDVLGGKCCNLPSCSRAMHWGFTNAQSPSRSIAHTNIVHQPGQAGAEQLSFHLRVVEKKNKMHKKEETKIPFGCEAPRLQAEQPCVLLLPLLLALTLTLPLTFTLSFVATRLGWSPHITLEAVLLFPMEMQHLQGWGGGCKQRSPISPLQPDKDREQLCKHT